MSKMWAWDEERGREQEAGPGGGAEHAPAAGSTAFRLEVVFGSCGGLNTPGFVLPLSAPSV